MKRNLKTRSVQFTTPQLEWLEKEAEEIGVSVADLIRRIIDDYRGENPFDRWQRSTERTRSN